METRYCIEYINPQYPLRDDGSLNVRYDRVLTLEQAEHDLTIILSFGGKILDLYMGNVVDGETGEWSPKPMIIDDDDWFSTKWLNTLEVKDVQDIPVSEEFEDALAKEWQGYNDRGAATVDALEDNTQELAFAKGFYRGAKWQEDKDQGAVEIAREEIYEWLKEHSQEYVYWMDEEFGKDDMINHLKQAMKDK